MVGEIISTGDLGVTYLKSAEAIVVMDSEKPSRPVVKDEDSQSEVAFWGEDNLFPQNVMKEVRKNGTISAGLDFQLRALYSGGVEYGKIVDGTFVPQKIPEIEAFKTNCGLDRYIMGSISDLYHLGNIFPELYLSNDRKKIVLLHRQPAITSRWEKLSAGEIVSKRCHYADWENSPSKVTKVHTVNPYYFPLEQLRNGTETRYVYPVSYPDPSNKLYSLAPWHPVLNSSWPEIANAIPVFKKALLKNQITIKYMIRVSEKYWLSKFPDWQTLGNEKKKEHKKAAIEVFNDFLSGEGNAGKSIMIDVFSDELGEKFPGWEITPIDDKLKDGVYLEDSQEANQHLLFSMSLDPVLIGISPGTKMGGSGGSDKRVAYNNFLALTYLNRHLILSPLDFITKYNEWGDDIVWRFKTSLQTSLDSSKEPKQTAA